MTAAIEPDHPQFQLKYARQITLCETRRVETQTINKRQEIEWCCCCSEGPCAVNVHFEKDGYMPGELVQIIVQADNSECKVDVPNSTISVDNTVTMSSQGRTTNSHNEIYSKTTNGMSAGQTLAGPNAIRQSFNLPVNQNIKPTCSGTLLNSQYYLSVTLNHDVCQCCNDKISAAIPVVSSLQ